jgi:phosphohistidine phosphatase
MRLVIVRHADAGEAEQFARTKKPDSLRPLSAVGRQTMQSVALGLRKLVPQIERVVTSPFTRAAQTASILCAAYDIAGSPLATPALEPEKPPAEFEAWLAQQSDAKVIAAVGHDPHVGTLATWFMTGVAKPGLHLEKGGACLLEFEGAVRGGEAVLQWLNTAEQLARGARMRARSGARRG